MNRAALLLIATLTIPAFARDLAWPEGSFFINSAGRVSRVNSTLTDPQGNLTLATSDGLVRASTIPVEARLSRVTAPDRFILKERRFSDHSKPDEVIVAKVLRQVHDAKGNVVALEIAGVRGTELVQNEDLTRARARIIEGNAIGEVVATYMKTREVTITFGSLEALYKSPKAADRALLLNLVETAKASETNRANFERQNGPSLARLNNAASAGKDLALEKAMQGSSITTQVRGATKQAVEDAVVDAVRE